MLDKFRVKVTIFATLIITMYCFFSSTNFLKTGYSIIFTIVVFYILSGIAELELKSHIEKSKIDEENEIQQEEEFENNDLDIEQDIDDLNMGQDIKDEETEVSEESFQNV